MGIRFIALAACLLALTMAAGNAFAKEIGLQRTDLRRLFVGNTLIMEHNGRITYQFTARDGSVFREFSDGSKSGFWEIKGARNPRICYEFPASVAKCYIVFRDDVSDDFYIYKYRNKRKDKLVFRVTRVREGNTIAPPPPPKADETVRLSRKMLRRVQTRLNKRGFDAGKPDGVMGARTRNAIADYQRFIGEPATGRLTEDQLDRLLN